MNKFTQKVLLFFKRHNESENAEVQNNTQDGKEMLNFMFKKIFKVIEKIFTQHKNSLLFTL